MPKARKWRRWAVVSKTGLCIRGMNGAAAIYWSERIAQADCAGKQYVQRVEIRELKPRSKR